MAALRDLYPPIEPYKQDFLKVSTIHTLYFEESGNPDGKPIIFLHGGPGGGTEPKMRRYFEPSKWRIILFDQRGCGKSTPSASLEDNTTWDLVSDIEKLRVHLSIDKWVVFGGSWGSTLSLTYAQSHPSMVKALILRGIFTLRRRELEFFYQGPGTNFIFPDYWKEYEALIPAAERHDMMAAYYKRLTSTDPSVSMTAAKTWSKWECATSKLFVDPKHVAEAEKDAWAAAFARIECHYFVHGGWMRDGQLLETAEIDKIRHIPTTIVQGRYDVVCPATTAFELHEKWPEADFKLVSDAGHSASEPGIVNFLIEATDGHSQG